MTDPEAVRRAKDEQRESVRLLKETGEREFNLPLHWLHTDEDAETETNDGEGSPGGGGSKGVMGGHVDLDDEQRSQGETDSSTENEIEESDFRGRRGWAGLSKKVGRANDKNNVTVREGWFAFFVATEAPFLVGKILAERLGDDGEPGVDLHWLRPGRDHIRDNAACMTLDNYGRVTFVEGYVHAGGGGSGRRMRPKREKDVSWEPVVGIVSTCEKLIGNGKKIPTKVMAKIKSAIEASQGVSSFLREPGKSNTGGEQGEEDDDEIARGGDREMPC